MIAADLAEEGELEGETGPAPTEDEGGSDAPGQEEKALQEKEEIERENDLIKKFGFAFDDEGQIIPPEVCPNNVF